MRICISFGLAVDKIRVFGDFSSTGANSRIFQGSWFRLLSCSWVSMIEMNPSCNLLAFY